MIMATFRAIEERAFAGTMRRLMPIGGPTEEAQILLKALLPPLSCWQLLKFHALNNGMRSPLAMGAREITVLVVLLAYFFAIFPLTTPPLNTSRPLLPTFGSGLVG